MAQKFNDRLRCHNSIAARADERYPTSSSFTSTGRLLPCVVLLEQPEMPRHGLQRAGLVPELVLDDLAVRRHLDRADRSPDVRRQLRHRDRLATIVNQVAHIRKRDRT